MSDDTLKHYRETCWTFLLCSPFFALLYFLADRNPLIIAAFAAISIGQLHLMYTVRKSHREWVRATKALERAKKFTAERTK